MLLRAVRQHFVILALLVGTTGVIAGCGAEPEPAALGAPRAEGKAVLAELLWMPAAPMNVKHDTHTATLLASGKVLVVGGYNDTDIVLGTTVNAVELFDPAANTWALAAPLSSARGLHTATLLASGKVLVVGGGGIDGGAFSSVEVYDPTADSWTPVGSLSAARLRHTATLLPNGKVLVAGGETAGGAALATVELYDPAQGSWTAAAPLGAARASHTATLLPNGKVLVAGGMNVGDFLGSAELFDPATNAWTPAAAMSESHAIHTATLLPNGEVLVAGGVSLFKGTAERYNPTSNTWTSAGAMAQIRIAPTATLLPNGAVLVTGGGRPPTSNGTPTGTLTTELYSPGTNTWASAEPLSEIRWWHTATLLRSGDVLVAGGRYNVQPFPSLTTVDRYTPTAPGGPCATDASCPSGTCVNGICATGGGSSSGAGGGSSSSAGSGAGGGGGSAGGGEEDKDGACSMKPGSPLDAWSYAPWIALGLLAVGRRRKRLAS